MPAPRVLLLVLLSTLAPTAMAHASESATAPASAGERGDTDDGAHVEPASAEQDRLLHELDKLATKGAWKGVERTWKKLLALPHPPPASAWRTAGDAARQRGDATEAQRRYLKAERLAPTSTNEALSQYRESYGVLEVRRLDASCIRLQPAELPFDPSQAASIRFAEEALKDAGAFRGLVPVGDYLVGPHRVSITPGMKPHVVQRIAGDSDCS